MSYEEKSDEVFCATERAVLAHATYFATADFGGPKSKHDIAVWLVYCLYAHAEHTARGNTGMAHSYAEDVRHFIHRRP